MLPLSPSSSNSQLKKLALSRTPSKRKTQAMQKPNQKQIPRNPLQDLNSRSRFRSSNTSSSSLVSADSSKGCLRFRQSQSSSSSSSSSSMKSPGMPVKRLNKTPKAAPVVKTRSDKGLLKSKPAFSKENLTKGTAFEKLAVQKPLRCKKSPTSLHLTHSGKNLSLENVLISGNRPIRGQLLSRSRGAKQKQHEIVADDDNVGQSTPVTKLETVLDLNSRVDDNLVVDHGLNSGSSNSNTPPVLASVSPEIQCGTPLVTSTTPACYSAGYIVSGVSDNRKCRARGILTIVDNDLGLCKLDSSICSDGIGKEDKGVGDSNISMIPLPEEASMHWVLSPCDEAKENSHDGSWCGDSETHSPISDNGFSSDICNISSGMSLSMENNGKKTRRSVSSFSPSEFSELKLMDHLLNDSVDAFPHHECDASPSKQSKDERAIGFDFGEDTPSSVGTLGSENVIQTPESDSSLYRHHEISWLEAEDHNKELDHLNVTSLTNSLQKISLSPKGCESKPVSIDSSFRFDSSTTNSGCFGDTQESHLQASWMPDMNEFAKFESTESLNKESVPKEEEREKRFVTFPRFSAESISTDASGLICSEDSDWMACYRNHFDV